MKNGIIYFILFALMLVMNLPALAQIPMPDTVCVGTTKTYFVNDSFTKSSYTWTINGVAQTERKNYLNRTWTHPGIYELTVQEHAINGCEGNPVSGLVHVMAAPIPNAGNDTLFCFGDIPFLNGAGGQNYQWNPTNFLSNPNARNPNINIQKPGSYKYYLSVANAGGCKGTEIDSVIITILPPVKIFAGDDIIAGINQPVQLKAIDVSKSGFIHYSWAPSHGLDNPFIHNPIAILKEEITYSLIAKTADGCEAKDEINIKVILKPGLLVPNIFTPNGDGKNDVLKPILIGMKNLKYFRVFNQYGEIIFSSSNPAAGWDGTYNGLKQKMGTYVWIAEAVDLNGKIFFGKGTVVLTR